MKTKITELFNIEHPILCGGMFRVGHAELAAAVSDAGGLGFITSAQFETPEDLRDAIKIARKITSKPIGVNITLSPRRLNLPNDKYIEVLIDEDVEIVETAGQNPEKYLKVLKDYNVKVIHKVPTIKYAKKAEKIGIDAVTIVGIEAGGHPGMGDIGSMVLTPEAVDTVNIPVVAAGGIADGRGLVAALSLGADGILMGTRFMATQEACIHDDVKKWMVEATGVDSHLIQRTVKSTHRVARNSVSTLVKEMEEQGETIDKIYPLIKGTETEKVLYKGILEAGVWSCGTSIGLIKDIPTVKETIDKIIVESELVKSRINSIVK